MNIIQWLSLETSQEKQQVLESGEVIEYVDLPENVIRGCMPYVSDDVIDLLSPLKPNGLKAFFKLIVAEQRKYEESTKFDDDKLNIKEEKKMGKKKGKAAKRENEKTRKEKEYEQTEAAFKRVLQQAVTKPCIVPLDAAEIIRLCHDNFVYEAKNLKCHDLKEVSPMITQFMTVYANMVSTLRSVVAEASRCELRASYDQILDIYADLNTKTDYSCRVETQLQALEARFFEFWYSKCMNPTMPRLAAKQLVMLPKRTRELYAQMSWTCADRKLLDDERDRGTMRNTSFDENEKSLVHSMTRSEDIVSNDGETESEVAATETGSEFNDHHYDSSAVRHEELKSIAEASSYYESDVADSVASY